MDKYEIALISVTVLGFVIFVTGLALSNYILSEVGGAMIVLIIVVFKLEQFESRRKSLLESMENKDQSILPQLKAKIKKREIIPMIMSVLITAIIIGFMYIMLDNYFLKISQIDVNGAVKDGCAKLNMGGTCITDPAKIIVPYDVNKDGTVGGNGDTFTNLLKNYFNCTGACVRKRCGCPS
jgi:L-lactate permease